MASRCSYCGEAFLLFMRITSGRALLAAAGSHERRGPPGSHHTQTDTSIMTVSMTIRLLALVVRAAHLPPRLPPMDHQKLRYLPVLLR